MNELAWTEALYKLVEDKFSEKVVLVDRERRLWDRTRIDLLTDRWAVEVDWAYKWTEAVGQCMWYSLNTNREPGIVLLVKDWDSERKYIYRCRAVCTKLDIFLWLVDTVTGEAIDSNGTRHKMDV